MIYCKDNPVMNVDHSGYFFISDLLIGALVGCIIGAGDRVVSQGITNGWNNIKMWQVLFDGTISGLLSVSEIGMVVSAFISGGLGFVRSVGGDLIASNGDWSSINWDKVVINCKHWFRFRLWC